MREGPTMNVTAIGQADSELTDEQKQELDRFSRSYDTNPEDVIAREDSWASIVMHLDKMRADYAEFNAVMAKVTDIEPMSRDEL
jgi:hypothetical protein